MDEIVYPICVIVILVAIYIICLLRRKPKIEFKVGDKFAFLKEPDFPELGVGENTHTVLAINKTHIAVMGSDRIYKFSIDFVTRKARKVE